MFNEFRLLIAELIADHMTTYQRRRSTRDRTAETMSMLRTLSDAEPSRMDSEFDLPVDGFDGKPVSVLASSVDHLLTSHNLRNVASMGVDRRQYAQQILDNVGFFDVRRNSVVERVHPFELLERSEGGHGFFVRVPADMCFYCPTQKTARPNHLMIYTDRTVATFLTPADDEMQPFVTKRSLVLFLHTEFGDMSEFTVPSLVTQCRRFARDGVQVDGMLVFMSVESSDMPNAAVPAMILCNPKQCLKVPSALRRRQLADSAAATAARLNDVRAYAALNNHHWPMHYMQPQQEYMNRRKQVLAVQREELRRRQLQQMQQMQTEIERQRSDRQEEYKRAQALQEQHEHTLQQLKQQSERKLQDITEQFRQQREQMQRQREQQAREWHMRERAMPVDGTPPVPYQWAAPHDHPRLLGIPVPSHALDRRSNQYEQTYWHLLDEQAHRTQHESRQLAGAGATRKLDFTVPVPPRPDGVYAPDEYYAYDNNE
jgi:hypothetical protein